MAGLYRDAFPQTGWIAENGSLTVTGDSAQRGGDIVITAQYGNFELSVDFKLTPGANSGIKYLLLENPKDKRAARPRESGVVPEYQNSYLEIK